MEISAIEKKSFIAGLVTRAGSCVPGVDKTRRQLIDQDLRRAIDATVRSPITAVQLAKEARELGASRRESALAFVFGLAAGPLLLADSLGQPGEDYRTHASLLHQRDMSDALTARAIREVLIPGLPGAEKHLFNFFSKLPKIPAGESRFFRTQMDVKAFGPLGAALAERGISPLRLYYSLRAVDSVVSSVHETGGCQESSIRVGLESECACLGMPIKQAVAQEIAALAEERRPAICGALAGWALDAVRHNAFALQNWRVTKVEDGAITFERTPESGPQEGEETSFIERWLEGSK